MVECFKFDQHLITLYGTGNKYRVYLVAVDKNKTIKLLNIFNFLGQKEQKSYLCLI